MSGTVEVSATGAAADAISRHLPALIEERFASRLFDADPTLWGEQARAEAAERLGWVDLPRTSRPLLGQIRALRAELVEQGLDRIVLCGMGGSSLAPEVICATYGVDLTVLDSSDPRQVRAAVEDDLAQTVVVVSSKSGSTVETDSQKRIFEDAFTAAGIDPAERIVVVTDPGSPLETSALAAGYRVINADPQVGGRYSALSAFGLVPSGLAGADVEDLLDQAAEVVDMLTDDDDFNLGLRLGCALAGTEPLRDKLVFTDEGSESVGLGHWIEQLIAESTGKAGTGLLPVIVEPGAPELASSAADLTTVHLIGDEPPTIPASGSHLFVAGGLGAQFLLWETATAVAGRLLGINPFDQPDVESAKQAARALLDNEPSPEPPVFTDGVIEVRASAGLLSDQSSVAAAVATLLDQVGPDGYLAVMAYLDRTAYPDLAAVRRSLATRLGRPVTFGWGPRFLHSTGQLHKGGPATGVYLQITGTEPEDLAVPGRPFTLGTFIAAQAAGDASVLADGGRPVLRLHLSDVALGLPELRSALG